jgi:hypothetical protein
MTYKKNKAITQMPKNSTNDNNIRFIRNLFVASKFFVE